MDMSSYSHENEILLSDGTPFVVQSVENDRDNHGNPIKLITLQCEGIRNAFSFILSITSMWLV